MTIVMKLHVVIMPVYHVYHHYQCNTVFSEDSAGSICEGNEFACSVSGPCIPLVFLCNGVGNCPNGDDESLCGKRS